MTSEPGKTVTAEVVDVVELKERVEDDELIEQLFAVFIDSNKPLLEQLDAAAAVGNTEEIKSLSHCLKGSAATMSAKPLAQLAYVIEQAGSSGQLDSARQALEQIKEEFERVKQFVQRRGWEQG